MSTTMSRPASKSTSMDAHPAAAGGKTPAGKASALAAKIKEQTKSSTTLLLFYIAQVAGKPAGAEIPAEVKLTDCSIEYINQRKTPGLLVGIFGTTSKQDALQAHAVFNDSEMQRRGGPREHILRVDLKYNIESLEATRQRVTAESRAESGWLDLERVSPDMREQLRQRWLKWIAASEGAQKAARHQGSTLLELAFDFPQVVPILFKEDPSLLVVLHRVRLAFDPKCEVTVGTVRLEPARLEKITSSYGGMRVKAPE